jgi:energy-coupling factor transport system ATP-binding protein
LSYADVPSVAIDALSVQYPQRVEPALREVTASLPPGSRIAVSGPSGGGKSTLLRTLAGFIPSILPAEVQGEIRVDGQSLFDGDPARWSPRVGLVQQDPDAQICTLRVHAEVAFGPENLCLPREEVDARVRSSLAVMGISHLADRDTTTLSGGEKQRLALASILAMQPAILLLDEPTAHLDPPSAKALLELLVKIGEERGCSLLVAEHRLLPLLPLRPTLWTLESGRLTVTETLPDLFARPRLATEDVPFGRVRPRHGEPLRIDNLSFGYDQPLLEGLSLDLLPGRVLGVIGPNGGGKTSLLRLIAGLETPTEGRIVIPPSCRTGMVFQHPHQQIFERTVRRDLEIEGALDEHALRDHLHGARLDGLSDVSPLSLSLGQQRRLTVLSALRTKPRVILLDEPFIGQDPPNVRWIADQILSAKDRGAIVILVTHDVPLAERLCDDILFLARPPRYGSPQEVFAELDTHGWSAFTPGFWGGSG